MTREEMQEVIDNGGYLVSSDDELHIGSKIVEDEVYFDRSIMLYGGTEFYGSSYHISTFIWRKATEEEIKKYVKP